MRSRHRLSITSRTTQATALASPIIHSAKLRESGARTRTSRTNPIRVRRTNSGSPSREPSETSVLRANGLRVCRKTRRVARPRSDSRLTLPGYLSEIYQKK